MLGLLGAPPGVGFFHPAICPLDAWIFMSTLRSRGLVLSTLPGSPGKDREPVIKAPYTFHSTGMSSEERGCLHPDREPTGSPIYEPDIVGPGSPARASPARHQRIKKWCRVFRPSADPG